MSLIPRAVALLALAAAAVPLRAQTQFDTVQVRVTAVSRNVYMLTGSGGNIGLAVGDDAVFVVDDQFAPLTPKILAAIATVTSKPVRFVFNTHWHFDHTGGNENLGRAGGLIVAHENVRSRMSSDQFIEALNRREPASPVGALPVVTFTKANVVHTGDTFGSAGLPFVDLSSGGSIAGVIAVAERVHAMANDQTRIIPGHGPVADRARIGAFRDMLMVLRERMRAELVAGKSLDQIIAAKITSDYAKDWPGGHDRFVRLLYQELSNP